MTIPGAGGQTPPRPDQAGISQPSGVVVSPGTSATIVAKKVIIVGSNGQLLVYNPTQAAGNLLISIAGVAGTDQFGNTIHDGMTIYHGTADMQIHVNQTQNVPAIEMPTGVGTEAEHASIYTIPTNVGLANEFIELNLIGPGSSFDNSTPMIVLASAEANGAVPANLQFQVPGGVIVFYVYSNGIHFIQPLYGTGGVLTIGDSATFDNAATFDGGITVGNGVTGNTIQMNPARVAPGTSSGTTLAVTQSHLDQLVGELQAYGLLA